MRKFVVIISVVLAISFTSFASSLRVVAGTVAIAEILAALEVDTVVGVPNTQYELPVQYQNLPRIGQPMNPSIELIRSLSPDLFVTSASLRNSLENRLAENKINSVFLDLDSPETFWKSVLELGQMLGKKDEAARLYKDHQERIDALLEKIKDKPKPSVLIIFGAPGNFMIATDSSAVGGLVRILGAENVVKDKGSSYLPLNMEFILNLQPDYILRMTHADPARARAMFEKEFSENPLWGHFKAVQQGKVIDLPNQYFGTSLNMRITEAIEMLARFLYGI